MSTDKLWGGRFAQPTDAFMEGFSASIAYDARLFRHDLHASRVHARMLGRQGIIPQEEAERIVAGLDQVRGELERGELPFSDALEDIHMHVEHRLHELIGPVAGKLHTARSRNDQVATDLRLYLRDHVDGLREQLRRLQWAILKLAEREHQTIMPGFTHMQSAQPVTFGHHLMAWSEMVERDDGRLGDLRQRLNQMPLGCAALAGTTFPIDREWVAAELGFAGVCRNSLDAVSDRDFAMELAGACAIVMVHLSRWSEELILWISPAFGFIDLPDAFCTGSSIMPQKKNPDAAELTRGKSGRVIGDLVALLTLMKGLPLAYNRDMQEDKEPIFDAVDQVRACVRVFTEMLPGLTVKREAMRAMAASGFATATDLADYLVRRGVPFREAHGIVGRIVGACVSRGCALEELGVEAMRAIDPRIGGDVGEVLTLEASVNARQAVGGTAFKTVFKGVMQARLRLMERIVAAL